MRRSLLLGILGLSFAGAVVAQTGMTEPRTSDQAGNGRILSRATLGRLPLCFVENRGVYSEEVRYYVPGADKLLFFTDQGVTFALKGKRQGWTVKLDFEGANPDIRPEGLVKQPAVVSYFTGPRADWKTNLRTFSRVVYRDLWPGIDLVYRGTVNKLKYEFVVRPGADPSRIRLRYRGASSISLTGSGALAVATPAGAFEDAPPEAWQEIDGKRVTVEMAYRLDTVARDGVANMRREPGRSFTFRVSEYDTTQTLILDPAILVYCGFLGGKGEDHGYAIAADRNGNAYVTGYTTSWESRLFPLKVGPDLTFNGMRDAFVAKVNTTGTGLVYCGYIGGDDNDFGEGIAVDAKGHAYVAGWTRSGEQSFPVKVGPDLTHNGGGHDAFVAKVTPTGTGLVYCGYIGGSDEDHGLGVALDAGGHAYVVGHTSSTEKSFPVAVGPDLTHNGSRDVFVAKVASSGTSLLYCGYLGGSNDDDGHGIAVDGAGSAYLTGYTRSDERTFGMVKGPDVTYNGGVSDAFVAKVSATGTGLAYCGYLGGGSEDWGSAIAVDEAGCAYVAGHTWSKETSFPVVVGPDLTWNGGYTDAYVAKVRASGSRLEYCGYIGGASEEAIHGIALDAARHAYVVGSTLSTERTFPVVAGPLLTCNISGDVFVAKATRSGKSLAYCGYIGGSGQERGHGVAVDAAGNAYVTGVTLSTHTTFPVVVGPALTHSLGFPEESFVAKVASTVVSGTGSPSPGGRVSLSLFSAGDAGLRYQVGSSLGTGPVMVGPWRLALGADPLLAASTAGALPGIFQNFAGVLDARGEATAGIRIPSHPGLKSLRIYTAFVTLNASAPFGIENISNAFVFTIQ